MSETEQQTKESKLGVKEGAKPIAWYDKNYKKLLILPLVLLILSIAYIGIFYSQNGDFIRKDVSLTGGTTITIFGENTIDIENLRNSLSNEITDFSIRELSDLRSGKQEAIIVESSIDSSILKQALEGILEYELTNENSSIEFTGSSLSNDFYKQLLYAILLSFSFMALVVFFIFGGYWKVKASSVILTLIPVILFSSGVISINIAIIANILVLLFNFIFYLKHSIPSVAVVTSAFADIIMTLALVDLLGITVSSAGIIAFLMLIGYSVDTDIMLTSRLLKRKESEINTRLYNAFKTGMTMTLSSIVAVGVALIFTYTFSETLKQIFTILLIGLGFDLFNTWITNASILKWFLEKKD